MRVQYIGINVHLVAHLSAEMDLWYFCTLFAVRAEHFNPPIAGYERVFLNGAILREAGAIPGADTVPLTLYWNSRAFHSLATTSVHPQPGYTKLMVLGFLCVNPGCGKSMPTPQPAGPVLSGLPGALQDDCQASDPGTLQAEQPPSLRARWSSTEGLRFDSAPSSLQHGNLKITATSAAPTAGLRAGQCLPHSVVPCTSALHWNFELF